MLWVDVLYQHEAGYSVFEYSTFSSDAFSVLIHQEFKLSFQANK